jgi:hypothetical protein
LNPADIKNNKVHVDMKMVGGKKVPRRNSEEVQAES